MTHADRDRGREREFLAKAVGEDRSAFVVEAQARLTAGEQLYGDRWARVGIRRLLEELVEEAVDLGAWAALAEQAVDLEPRLSDVQAAQVRGVLALAARRGAQAHDVLAQIVRSLPGLVSDRQRA
jgi:hypothetical protein